MVFPTPAWAASAMDKWYGKAWRERPHYGATLQAGERRGIQALPALLELAAQPAAPPIVRATAAFDDIAVVAEASRGLGEAMVGINVSDLPAPHRLAERGW